jgi:segregation and condensation protein B
VAAEPPEVPLPDDEARIESILESLLFAADRPLTVADFKRLLDDPNGTRLGSLLERLRERHAATGIQLVQVAGAWQLRTHPANGAWVAKLVAGRPQRLSRAMMETLAIVAYRQPITRPEVDEIRGVDCGPVLRTLLERGLVRAIGKKEEVGRPILYGTTPDFLKTFSMRDLTELPTLREFHELGAEERAKVDTKLGAGQNPGPGAAVGPGSADPSASALPVLTVSELPNYDPAEEDSLIDELENATRVATHAVRVHTDPETNPETEPNTESGAGSGTASGPNTSARSPNTSEG